jgi:16S rRNA (cytidine1402-2'-O)-methyltransferase
LVKTLRQIAEYFGKERNISVSRELTKIHEENVRGTVEELLEYFDGKTVKGEIVMVVEGKKL